jgi:hypothetical protein
LSVTVVFSGYSWYKWNISESGTKHQNLIIAVLTRKHYNMRVRVLVFSATFRNISLISWVPRENHSHWQTLSLFFSYKLWYNYLKLRRRQVKGKCVNDPAVEDVCNAHERAVVFMHKVW